jgi:hypothetical protein
VRTAAVVKKMLDQRKVGQGLLVLLGSVKEEWYRLMQLVVHLLKLLGQCKAGQGLLEMMGLMEERWSSKLRLPSLSEVAVRGVSASMWVLSTWPSSESSSNTFVTTVSHLFMTYLKAPKCSWKMKGLLSFSVIEACRRRSGMPTTLRNFQRFS